jgi:glycosyltransferase involved in cell wall biosynthesis
MMVLSHPTGNEFVRQALIAFDEVGMLGEFWTTLSWNRDSLVNQLLPVSLCELLRRRSYPAAIRSRTRTVPWREIGRLVCGACSVDAVSLGLDEKVAARLRRMENCDVIYAYEDAARQSFRFAAQRGIARIYDLPIGYWRVGQRIFAEEREREPEWAATLTGSRDSAEKLACKDEELQLAQRVIVASTFTKETLAEAPCPTRIDIVPYGAPPPLTHEIRRSSGPLKVLFAGSLGQRKGLSYLLKAIEMMKDSVELTLLGRKTAFDCRPLESAVRKYRWLPSLPHAGVLREMQNHDVLVFPSLFEGFGLVILEAMSQGTPVITTPHTAGPDIILDGVDGFIVPIGSAEAIAEKLETLHRERERLRAMKVAAREKAASRTWEKYRERLVALAREVVGIRIAT